MMKKKVKIKLCGLTSPQDIYTVNQYMPDMAGFVFSKQSRRYVTPQQAFGLKQLLSPAILSVGVFVNESREQIVRLCSQRVIDAIQLHGQETESDIRWLKGHTGKTLIKAINVRSVADLAYWSGSCADYLLLDHGAGGTGRSFDWNLASACTKPFFLAGGINSRNLASALSTGAYAVDLSSGAETDGKKDPLKIAAIMRIMHTQNTLTPNERSTSYV